VDEKLLSTMKEDKITSTPPPLSINREREGRGGGGRGAVLTLDHKREENNSSSIKTKMWRRSYSRPSRRSNSSSIEREGRRR
jgi:hypothetical protein